MYLQRTIKKRVTVAGIGLHTGEPTQLTFRPAPADTGVHLVRVDLPGAPSVKVHAENVRATALATTLGGPGFSVSTVEHCLSALAAFRIDNVLIELNGPEVPIGDGSALPFFKALLEAEFAELESPRHYITVVEPVFYGESDKHAYVLPYPGLRLTCTIEFPHPQIGRQRIDVDINEKSFSREVGSARTFGFLKDVEALRARGLAKGGSMENAIVLNDAEIMNPEGLRFPNEFVRHKVLDALGDLVTLGQPLLGHVVLFKAGHDIMNKLAKKILAAEGAWRSSHLGGKYRDQATQDRAAAGVWTPSSTWLD